MNAVYREINSQIEKRQSQAKQLINQRKKQVYDMIPELYDIDRKIGALGISLNKNVLFGIKPDSDENQRIKSEIDKCIAHKESLMEEHGFYKGYIEDVYQCKKCNDTGVDGQGKCSCYKQMFVDMIYNKSSIKNTQEQTFDNFDYNLFSDKVDENRYGIPVSPRDNIRYIRQCAEKFIENFQDKSQKNLIFIGASGTGKTFLTNCITFEIMKKGNTVIYQTAPEMFNTINKCKAKVFNGEDEAEDIYDYLMEVDLLVIDDLGTETKTASRYAELFSIINTRALSGKKIIISTNLELKDIYQQYDERILSRIAGNFDAFKFAGDDIRIIKSKEE